jgi:guanylate kinase
MKEPTPDQVLKKIVKNSFSTPYKSIKYYKAVAVDKYRPTIILVFGPSTVGKDTVIQRALELPFVSFVTTATSRPRRAEEDHNAYIWLREKHAHETKAHYLHAMLTENSLVEWDFHNRFLYGIPRKSIEQSLSSGIAIIRTNFHGATVLKDVLSYTANVIVIAIHPETWNELEERIVKLRKRPKLRIKEALQSISAAEDIANYVIVNSFKEGYLEKTQEEFKNFLTDISNQRE